MRIAIHPSEALSDNICACCGTALRGETSHFVISLESVITRETDAPPLHRKCAIAHAKSRLHVVAIWESGYTFDWGDGSPVFYLEKAVRPLEFDGSGDCSPEGISAGLAAAWLNLPQELQPYAERLGQSAAALLPRKVDFSKFDLGRSAS